MLQGRFSKDVWLEFVNTRCRISPNCARMWVVLEKEWGEVRGVVSALNWRFCERCLLLFSDFFICLCGAHHVDHSGADCIFESVQPGEPYSYYISLLILPSIYWSSTPIFFIPIFYLNIDSFVHLSLSLTHFFAISSCSLKVPRRTT